MRQPCGWVGPAGGVCCLGAAFCLQSPSSILVMRVPWYHLLPLIWGGPQVSGLCLSMTSGSGLHPQAPSPMSAGPTLIPTVLGTANAPYTVPCLFLQLCAWLWGLSGHAAVAMVAECGHGSSARSCGCECDWTRGCGSCGHGHAAECGHNYVVAVVWPWHLSVGMAVTALSMAMAVSMAVAMSVAWHLCPQDPTGISRPCDMPWWISCRATQSPRGHQPALSWSPSGTW